MDLFFYPLLLIFNLGFAFRILPLFYFGSAIVGLDFVSFHVLDSDLAAVGLDLVSFSSIYSKVTWESSGPEQIVIHTAPHAA